MTTHTAMVGASLPVTPCTHTAPTAQCRPGAEHTFIDNAVATPTESGVLSRPDSNGFGRGESVRKAGCMALPVFVRHD